MQLEPFHPTVLRSNDIRGIVGETLNNNTAYTLGRLFGLRAKSVAVGYDGRLTSPDLAAAVARGLQDSGCDVSFIGMGPTPMAYFAERYLGTDGAIMVTGSHNPSAYNGFKISLHAKPFWGKDITQLNEVYKTLPAVTTKGTITTINMVETYANRLLQDYTGTTPKTVVWDVGNGAAGAILPSILKKLPGTHHVLFGDVDGRFPNHHPDPTVDANLVDLIAAVKKHGADVGIAFDGDGDRIGVVDNRGQIIRGDRLMCIYAADVLSRNPGAAIIADVKCSGTLFDEVTRLGGQAVMEKTGHSPIKAKMMELQSPLAGELSGHIFFADGYYGYDDALYAAIRLLNSCARQSFDQMLGHLPVTHATPELHIDVTEDTKALRMQDIRDALLQFAQQNPNYKINQIDGVRLDAPDGWLLVRPSNTTAILVARCEATTQKGLENLTALLLSYLEPHGLKLAA